MICLANLSNINKWSYKLADFIESEKTSTTCIIYKYWLWNQRITSYAIMWKSRYFQSTNYIAQLVVYCTYIALQTNLSLEKEADESEGLKLGQKMHLISSLVDVENVIGTYNVLKLVFGEIRVSTWVQVVSRKKIRGLFFFGGKPLKLMSWL